MKHGKIAIIALFFAHPTLALEAQHTNFDIKGTSLTELMNLKITSLSGISEDSNKLPAAVYVITGDEIKRMGVTQLAETLRYAPGVEVARSGANTWSISIRGLNVSNANKILVMIDGRNVYNLLFANVQWQQQDVLLDDIDRIEIIRGPGGVIWGTNAVNGVINIITKNSKDTQGVLMSAGSGSVTNALAQGRIGWKLGEDTYGRVYTKFTHENEMPNAASLNDASRMAQAGFRIDRHSATVGDMTWSGDIYRGVIGPNPNNIDPATRGQDYHGSNLLFNWIYNATTLQSHRFFAYLDSSRFNTNKGLTRSALNTMGQQIDNRNIVDLNYQITQRWQPQVLTWGAGYRRVSDNEDTRPSLQLIPMSKIDRTYSTFVQDDISVLKDKGHFILGTKYEHNPYTGSEWQPSVRTTYFIADSLVWAAWSRALRIPTRLEEDLSEPTLIGNTHLKAEAASVYEVGWRKVLRKGINLDVAAYTSKYINLVTVEGKTDGNKMSGRISGIEISPSLQLRPNWLVRFNYSHAIIHMGVSQTSLNKVLAVQTEDSLPSDMSELVSMYDINDQWQLNTFLRYVSQIKFQRVSPYTVLDTSIVWKPTKNISCQLVGRDLGKKHYERGFTTSPLVAPSIALYVTVKV